MAKETKKTPDIDELLPEDILRGPFRGNLSDILMMPESMRRAGRAAGLSEAAGEEDVPMPVSMPKTHASLSMMGGGLGGGALGALGDILLHSRNRSTPPILGLLGSVGGTLGGLGYSTFKRRNLINKLKQKIKEKELDTDKVTLGNPLASPWSGMHQLGKSDVITGDIDKKLMQNIATGSQLTRGLPNPALRTLGAVGDIGANVGGYIDAYKAHKANKTAGFRGPLDIMPPKSLGPKGIQHVLKDLSKRKKLTKQPFPYPSEVLDRVAGRIADTGFLRKKSEDKTARCWEGFEPVPGKKAYTDGSCRPKTETTKRVNKQADEISLEELTGGIKKLSELKKKGTSQVTIYYASPSQLTMIPRDAMVSTNEDLAFQMGRFYPKTKERWSEGDISGKWNGATPPTWKAGRIPTGRPKLYSATVSTTDLANVTNMVRDIKKLKRSVTAVAVRNSDEEN